MRYRLAKRVRDELDQRKRRLAIMTYDDLLTRLNDILAGPNGAEARERLRARYDVVLVDEFQDTDPIQWQILYRAFATGGVTLVLVADPKQAIYAFRGADVYAYLVAAATAATQRHAARQPAQRPATARRLRRVLRRRAARPRGDRLPQGQSHARAPDQPSDRRPGGRRAPHPGRPPRRAGDRSDQLRVCQGALGPRARRPRPRRRRRPAARLEATLEHRAADGKPTREEPVCPRHIAVLVRTHANADLVCAQLDAARVPAVINGGGNVFATATARGWLRLLEALERPAVDHPRQDRRGYAVPGLERRADRHGAGAGVGGGPPAPSPLGPDPPGQRRGCAHRGDRRRRGPRRADARRDVGGERRLTDLGHVADLLHRAAAAERLGVTALRGWLAKRIADAERGTAEDERTRRLDSDAEAVQVLTIHRSKGLEFPVVYCPFLWEPSHIPRDPEPVFFHDPATGFRRTIDVGLEGRAWNAHVRRHRAEQRGEDLQARLRGADSRQAPGGDLVGGLIRQPQLAARAPAVRQGRRRRVAPEGRSTPTDAAAVERFRELAAAAPGRIAVERSTFAGVPVAWSPPLEPPAELEAARFNRRLDLSWRRTSYTDITAEAHDPLVSSEPERPVLSDEPAAATPAAVTGVPRPGLNRESPLGAAPVGVQFGTFVHTVLEATDFTAPGLDAEIATQIASAQARRALDLGEPDRVVRGLRAAIETPLGPLVDGVRLRDVARADRLDELEFELPLAGGDEPTGRLTLQAIAAVLGAHLPGTDPMAQYASRLEDPALRPTVRGFLTGSIDLVMRLPGPRFAVVDYKTNWLGPAGEPLTLAHYQPEALAAEMSRAHYGLQALLYTVALHRYLRWRMPGYDPAATSPACSTCSCAAWPARPDAGVFAWSPPGDLVTALSGVLDRAAHERDSRAPRARSVRGPPRRGRRRSAARVQRHRACCRRPTCMSRCGWPSSSASNARS